MVTCRCGSRETGCVWGTDPAAESDAAPRASATFDGAAKGCAKSATSRPFRTVALTASPSRSALGSVCLPPTKNWLDAPTLSFACLAPDSNRYTAVGVFPTRVPATLPSIAVVGPAAGAGPVVVWPGTASCLCWYVSCCGTNDRGGTFDFGSGGTGVLAITAVPAAASMAVRPEPAAERAGCSEALSTTKTTSSACQPSRLIRWRITALQIQVTLLPRRQGRISQARKAIGTSGLGMGRRDRERQKGSTLRCSVSDYRGTPPPPARTRRPQFFRPFGTCFPCGNLSEGTAPAAGSAAKRARDSPAQRC